MRVTEFFSDLFVEDSANGTHRSLASLNGWIVDLSGDWADIHWDLDAMSADSEILGAGLLHLESELEDAWTYSTGIMIDRVGTEHRGNGLGPFAVRRALEYLTLGTADTTLSVLHAVAQGFEDESSAEFKTANKKVMKSWSMLGYSHVTPGSQLMWANVGELLVVSSK